MHLHAINPENMGDLELNFSVRKDEFMPSQPKIKLVSNDFSSEKKLYF